MNKYSQSLVQIPTLLEISPSPVTLYKQPREISDDQLRPSVTCRSLHNKKRNLKLTTGCFHGLEIK